MMGLPKNRIFYFVDEAFVPISYTYTSEGLNDILQEIGFREVQRFERGYADDTTEMLFRLGDIGTIIYGEGQHRYLATK